MQSKGYTKLSGSTAASKFDVKLYLCLQCNVDQSQPSGWIINHATVIELISESGTIVVQKPLYCMHYCAIPRVIALMSQCMRFPTMWYVRPAKPQISLRIRAV